MACAADATSARRHPAIRALTSALIISKSKQESCHYRYRRMANRSRRGAFGSLRFPCTPAVCNPRLGSVPSLLGVSVTFLHRRCHLRGLTPPAPSGCLDNDNLNLQPPFALTLTYLSLISLPLYLPQSFPCIVFPLSFPADAPSFPSSNCDNAAVKSLSLASPAPPRIRASLRLKPIIPPYFTSPDHDLRPVILSLRSVTTPILTRTTRV